MKILLISIITISLVSCDVVAPGVSKAKTEKLQLSEEKLQTELEKAQLQALETQNRLLAEQNQIWDRIATAMEMLAND